MSSSGRMGSRRPIKKIMEYEEREAPCMGATYLRDSTREKKVKIGGKR